MVNESASTDKAAGQGAPFDIWADYDEVRDILMCADEYALAVVTRSELERDAIHEYKDKDAVMPLVAVGFLELERHEIWATGAACDIYQLTDAGRAEIKRLLAEPTTPSEPVAPSPVATEPDEDDLDQYLQPIEHISRYVFAHVLMSLTGNLLFEGEGFNFDDQWETVHFLYGDIRDGVRHAFPGIHEKDVHHAQFICEEMTFT